MAEIILIAAMDEQGGLGLQNSLPWHLPADLRHFKQQTLNKTIVMGRKTYESIGRPLPNRNNIVLSQTIFAIEGARVIPTVKDVLMLAKEEPIYVIGGATLYQQFLPYANKAILTKIKGIFDVDTYFPLLTTDWQMESASYYMRDEKNAYDLVFEVWVNRKISHISPN